MSYDPEAAAGKQTIQPVAADEDDDEPPPPRLPQPKSATSLEACRLNGLDAAELEYREMFTFRKEPKELEEVVFRRFQAYEASRLLKLDAVLASRRDLDNAPPEDNSAMILAQEAENGRMMQIEVERLSRLRQQQQRKAEKEVRQVLLAQAAAAEMEEGNRNRAAEERRREAERDAEAKRKRDEFNNRKQEMERLKGEEERARNIRLRQEQLERLERERIRLEMEAEKTKERKKETVRKQKQKAEKQREHKMMMLAKTKQKELLAEKRLSEMAERDEIRRDAIALAQIETARRNAEIQEYQELRMHSIRDYQEKQLIEQREQFKERQRVATEKMDAMEKRKEIEFARRKQLEMEKEASREQIFVQMKQRQEDRRDDFLESQKQKEHLLELTRTKLDRERQVTKETLVLISVDKRDQVHRSKRKEEYQRDKARAKLAEKEETYKKIKQQKADLIKQRKAMQRQSHIERVHMLESLENLKTFGGKPDAALMSMLGDSWTGNKSSTEQHSGASAAEPEMEPLGIADQTSIGYAQEQFLQPETFPAIASAGDPPGSPPAEPPPSPRDIHVIRLEDLRRYQNEELLAALHQEHEKEKERELIIVVIDDGAERTRIDRLFGAERAKARRAIKRLTKQHERELKHMAARFEAESASYIFPETDMGPSSNSAQIRISSRQSIEAAALKKM